MGGKDTSVSESSSEFSHRDLDVQSIEVVNQNLLGAVIPSGLYTSEFKVSSDPDYHSLVRVHSKLNIIIDFILSIRIITDQGKDIGLGLSSVPEVRAVQVGSIVCLLEILIIHFERHLRESLPGRQPSRDVVHLVVHAHPWVVDCAHSLGISGKSSIGKVAPISHGGIVEAPNLVVGAGFCRQVVGQHDIIFELNRFSRCAGVYTVLDKRDFVSNRGVSKVHLSRVCRLESSRTCGPLSLRCIVNILNRFHLSICHCSSGGDFV